MNVLVAWLEGVGAAFAIAAIVQGFRWTSQDHKDTAERTEQLQNHRDEIDRLESERLSIDEDLSLRSDFTHVRTENQSKRAAVLQEIATRKRAIEILETALKGVPVAASQTALQRAKWAGWLGLTAVFLGALAGVLGALFGQTGS
jgi:hypothetical protein